MVELSTHCALCVTSKCCIKRYRFQLCDGVRAATQLGDVLFKNPGQIHNSQLTSV